MGKRAAPWTGKPLVLLINGSTASGAEIVAGAMQQLGLALLVGEHSFGKGSVQTILPFDRGGGMRLTTAKYLLPDGSSVEERADLPPDSSGARNVAGERRADQQTRGLTPDVLARPERLPRLAEECRRKGLVVGFMRSDSTLSGLTERQLRRQQTRERFSVFLDGQGLPYSDADLAGSWEHLSFWLVEEVLRERYGAPAAARFALDGDAQFLKAAELLRGVTSQDALRREVESGKWEVGSGK